jgi:hypothetical protein
MVDIETGDYSGDVSEWNEAQLKMLRIHRLQTEINVASVDFLGKSNIYGKYNYEYAFDLLTRLYLGEAKSTYLPEEITEVDSLKDVIDKWMISKPIFTMKVSIGYGCKQFVNVVNKDNWIVLKTLLEAYETKIKLYNDKHGLSTKKIRSRSGRSILR